MFTIFNHLLTWEEPLKAELILDDQFIKKGPKALEPCPDLAFNIKITRNRKDLIFAF